MLRASKSLETFSELTTEAAVQDSGGDRTKTDCCAASLRATLQPEVKFTTSKSSKTHNAGQKQSTATNGGKISRAIGVQPLAYTPKQFSPSLGPTFASKARDSFSIGSSWPKLKMLDFFGDLFVTAACPYPALRLEKHYAALILVFLFNGLYFLLDRSDVTRGNACNPSLH